MCQLYNFCTFFISLVMPNTSFPCLPLSFHFLCSMWNPHMHSCAGLLLCLLPVESMVNSSRFSLYICLFDGSWVYCCSLISALGLSSLIQTKILNGVIKKVTTVSHFCNFWCDKMGMLCFGIQDLWVQLFIFFIYKTF